MQGCQSVLNSIDKHNGANFKDNRVEKAPTFYTMIWLTCLPKYHRFGPIFLSFFDFTFRFLKILAVLFIFSPPYYGYFFSIVYKIQIVWAIVNSRECKFYV